MSSDPSDAATWRTASSLHDRLEAKAEQQDRPWNLARAQDLGKKLSTYHSELSELYGLEIADTGRVNKYRFDRGDDSGTPTGLGKF